MTNENSIYIVKMSGEREPWNSNKLERSLRAAKATNELVREIVGHVEKDLRDGMRTKDIYEHAFMLLKRYDRPVAAEYSLKSALMQLGPSGFPFERFVGRILEAQGYRTEVGVMVRGSCVTHEVDVVAEKDDERILVEAKFHNQSNIKSDVKVALYVEARFRDILKRFDNEDGESRYTHALLITNTNFTSQAIQFGNCANLALTGWNYPRGHTLQDLVQSTKTHPVTCLTTLTNPQKNHLLNKGIVLCQDIVNEPSLLTVLGLNKSRISAVIKEGTAVCAST